MYTADVNVIFYVYEIRTNETKTLMQHVRCYLHKYAIYLYAAYCTGFLCSYCILLGRTTYMQTIRCNLLLHM